MNAHFLGVLARIQYPEARFLAESVQSIDLSKFQGQERQVNLNARRITLSVADREVFFARQLVNLELFHATGSKDFTREVYYILPVADSFVEFVWGLPDDATASETEA